MDRTTNQPRKNPDGSLMAEGRDLDWRTLQTSGCGLFALSTLLGGYDVIVPGWDPSTKAFVPPAKKGTVDMRTPRDEGQPYGDTQQMGSPRAFVHFLWHYNMKINPRDSTESLAKDDTSTGILGSDPNGALQYSSALEGALAFLLTYHPQAYDAQGNYVSAPPGFGISLPKSISGNWPGGTDIPAITNSIIALHQPVHIGIGSDKCEHQVLVVGLVKYEGKTYYITIDSGFSGEAHPGPLLDLSPPLSWPQIAQFTVSTHATAARREKPTIYWYMLVTGNAALENAYDFTLYCKGVREW